MGCRSRLVEDEVKRAAGDKMMILALNKTGTYCYPVPSLLYLPILSPCRPRTKGECPRLAAVPPPRLPHRPPQIHHCHFIRLIIQTALHLLEIQFQTRPRRPPPPNATKILPTRAHLAHHRRRRSPERGEIIPDQCPFPLALARRQWGGGHRWCQGW